jgi:type III pantothenate kinase
MIADKHDGSPGDAGGEAPSANLLLVSVGNTRLTMASHLDGRRGVPVHHPIDQVARAAGDLQDLWNALPAGQKRAVVVSSVNPPGLRAFQAVCEPRGIGPVLVVGEDLDAPIAADVAEPEKVGTDRLCTAAAAFVKMQAACVVADFGTAVTVDLVGDDGVFLGGTIMPGLALAARALHEHTALLPLVDMAGPAETIGKDTAGAIRSGISAMMAGALREITERYATEIGKWPPLVVTGGDAEFIARSCDFVDRVVPDLLLDGLALAYRSALEARE